MEVRLRNISVPQLVNAISVALYVAEKVCANPTYSVGHNIYIPTTIHPAKLTHTYYCYL